MSSTLRTMILLIIATVSTVANYAGLGQTVPQDSLWWLLFCAAIAVAVGAAIYGFWQAAFEAVVSPPQFRLRGAGWIATLVGGAFILGISSYWNVTAIGGTAAQRAALQSIVTRAEEAVVGAIGVHTGYRSHLPALRSFSDDIGGLAECEARSGCITGSAGRSGVYETLGQLQAKVDSLITSTDGADAALSARARENEACLSDLRQALANDDADAVSGAADCVNAILADISGNGLSSRIADAMASFSAGVVIPVSVTSNAQRQAVANILEGLQARADAIGTAARASTGNAAPELLTLARMSPMKAVVVHWDAIIPSWITGIVLDLFPLILLSFAANIAASRRLRPDAQWHAFTAGDLLTAARILGHLKAQTEAKVDTGPEVLQPLLPDRSPNGIVYRTDRSGEPDYWYEDVDVREETASDRAERGLQPV